MLSIRFYFIFLLSNILYWLILIHYSLFFFYVNFALFLSCLHSTRLSRNALFLPGGEGLPPARKKASKQVVTTGFIVTYQIRSAI